MPPRRCRRLPPTLLGACGVAALALGCPQRQAPPPWAHRGPIVLITFDALRADAVGAFGGPPNLTPAFDALAREAAWAGPAIAPSSWTVPSMAALFTGLQPWRTENRHGDGAVLPAELVTLPQALGALGFATSGFYSGPWLRRPFGYDRGFDVFRYFREGKRAEARLASLGTADPGTALRPELVWAHVLAPHAPYLRREALLERLPPPLPPLPHKVRVLDLDHYFDPATELPPEQERVFRAMYQLNVAWADATLGRLLGALRRSGKWDETLLVVTSDHGEELKECGQVEHGGNLCRALIEVPLLVKLPAGWQGPPLAIRPGERPGTVRVRATLIEAAGGTPEPATAPSLFRPATGGVLSELYFGNGVNRVSYVEGDRQLVWTSRFAEPDPDYYLVHTLAIGGRPRVQPRTSPAALQARFEAAFARALPLSGVPSHRPTLELWDWLDPDPGTAPMRSETRRVDDARETAAMARRLKTAWVASNGAEAPPGPRTGAKPQLTPEEEAEIRALGYAAGKSSHGAPAALPSPTPAGSQGSSQR
jgi:hypothetical protein